MLSNCTSTGKFGILWCVPMHHPLQTAFTRSNPVLTCFNVLRMGNSNWIATIRLSLFINWSLINSWFFFLKLLLDFSFVVSTCAAHMGKRFTICALSSRPTCADILWLQVMWCELKHIYFLDYSDVLSARDAHSSGTLRGVLLAKVRSEGWKMCRWRCRRTLQSDGEVLCARIRATERISIDDLFRNNTVCTQVISGNSDDIKDIRL